MKFTLQASSILFALTLAAVGCGDDTTVVPDGGMTADTGTDTPMGTDGGTDTGMGTDTSTPPTVLATCAMPKMVTGTVGVVNVTGDTTNGPMPPLDLSPCGTLMDGASTAPQEVIAYTVPGDGTVTVTVNLANEGTPENFDTVIEIREACGTAPDPEISCFDDISFPDETRSAGQYAATGGSTLFIIVTGFGWGDMAPEDTVTEGAYSLDITARPTSPPVLVGAMAGTGTDGTFIASIEGTSTTGDATGYQARFLDAAGMTVDINGDDVGDEMDTFRTMFDNAAEIDMMMTFTGTSVTDALADVLPESGATQVEFILLSSGFLESDPMTFPLTALGDRGGACSDVLPCNDEHECNAAVCTAPVALAAVCSAATAVVIAPPVGTTASTSAVQTGSLAVGEGATTGSCGLTAGMEAAYTVTVPAGTLDLIASTETTETGEGDTVVYIRTACDDSSTESACDDDIGGGVAASQAVVENAAAGTYSVLVEQYGSAPKMALPYGIEFTLRPVLAATTACDPEGVMNRCAGDPCDAATSMCP